MQNKVKNEPSKSESKIQQEIAMYYRNSFCLKHHKPRCMILSIPNEGRAAASMQLMATGLYPGAADLMVIHQKEQWRQDVEDESVLVGYRSISLFIECKAEAGVQSDKQKEFEEHARAAGINYHIVRSLDEFKQVLKNL